LQKETSYADEDETEADEFAPDQEEEEEDADGDAWEDEGVTSDDGFDENGDNNMGSDKLEGESIVGPESENGSSNVRKTFKSSGQAKPPQKKSKPLTMGVGFGPGNVQLPSRFTKGTGTQMRQRGIEEWVKVGQENRWTSFFGPTNDEIQPVFQTRDHWHAQETLPSRAAGHLCRSYWVSEATHDKAVRTTRKWYEDTGRACFQTGQAIVNLNKQQGQGYMNSQGHCSMNLLLGEIQKPQLYALKAGEYMSTSKPFKSSLQRRGWMINLGARIQEVQWAPNEDGFTQYLATAVEQKSPATQQHKPMEEPKAPAFTATQPFPASIQIWAFDSTDNGDLDPSKPPRLEQVICTDWGAPKALRWCPISANESTDLVEGETVHLGLLAGIWSDGKVRVLDVSHRKLGPDSQDTQYIHYSRSALEIKLPETIPTCIQWLSGTTLAVATASGILAIWTLTHSGMFPTCGSKGAQRCWPQPWFCKQIADTYILTLSSGYPSRPQFISITTADGLDRIFDLRSPLFDTCSSTRGRMLVLTQAWHEHSQTFISPNEYYMLKHNPIRCYYKIAYSMRIESPITVCATSPVHPCILVGGSDGIVTATNPIMKVLNAKTRPWQQIWFKLEWRPPVERLALKIKPWERQARDEIPISDVVQGWDDGMNDIHHAVESSNDVTAPHTNVGSEATSISPPPEALSHPLIRITEGYNPNRPGMSYPDEEKRYTEAAKSITTYEAESAISRLAWNPNLKFGTWAAAGSNSGILRVEDLGD
jgi:transcription factor C subunit 6